MTSKAAVAIVLSAILLLSGMTAGEGEHGPEGASSGMLGKVVNFVLLFGALAYFLATPIKNFLAKRTTDIRAALDEARAAREDAERRLAETRARLAALEGDADRMKSEAEAEGRRARDGIRQLAEAEAARIRKLAAEEVEHQVKAGVQELKERTLELAAELAAEGMKKTIGSGEHSGLIDRSIERIEGFHEKPDPR
jgi:F-type H+-transporting ATPase subunit b